jgi:lysophospholipase L1-like esterase
MSRVLVPLILLAAVLASAMLVADYITRPQGEHVAVIGDSITAIGQQQLKISAGNDFVISATADFGATIASKIPAAQQLAAGKPKQVIINLGTNDALDHVPTDQSLAALRQMVDLFPDAKCIHFVTVSTHLDRDGDQPKAPAEALNRGILRLADRLDRGDVIRWDEMVADTVKITDPRGMTGDGIHPDPSGQRKLADAEVHALQRCGRPWHYW